MGSTKRKISCLGWFISCMFGGSHRLINQLFVWWVAQVDQSAVFLVGRTGWSIRCLFSGSHKLINQLFGLVGITVRLISCLVGGYLAHVGNSAVWFKGSRDTLQTSLNLDVESFLGNLLMHLLTFHQGIEARTSLVCLYNILNGVIELGNHALINMI